MPLDHLTKHAIVHTLHCLAGCAIGEVAGMVAGSILGWTNLTSTIVSILLAFFFGYLLTTISIRRRSNISMPDAVRTALATDTVSITSMEIIDNAFLWLVPGAMDAHIATGLFWGSLVASLVVAFAVTVPVNRWFMKTAST